ncbi:hypothetical protein, partial [Enterocloster clostridioformis]|uniref:hypothetical protein n=1 Tax=Enterocloster clostridioformis TaxID=1531 RepID=UPI003218FCAA
GKAAGGGGESGLMVPSGAVSKPGPGAAQGDRESSAELLMSSPPRSLSLGRCTPSLTPCSAPGPG